MLDTSIAPPVPEPSTRRHRWRWVAAAVTSIVLVLGAGWWVTHPNQFYGEPNGYILTTASAKVESTVLAGQYVVPKSGSVTLLSAEPNIVVNTAHASVELVLCTSTGEMLGSGLPPVSKWCSSLRDVHRMTYTGIAKDDPMLGQAYFVLIITPHWPGKIRVEGLKLHYRYGLQSGTQITGSTVIVPAHGG